MWELETGQLFLVFGAFAGFERKANLPESAPGLKQ